MHTDADPTPRVVHQVVRDVLARAARLRGIEPREESIVHPRFDVADVAPVSTTIVIASNPRTGSSLLVHSLAELGVGEGGEFWSGRAFGDGADRWGAPRPQWIGYAGQLRRLARGQHQWWTHGRFSEAELRRYQSLLERHRTTANGVFVTKLFVENVERLERRLGVDPTDLLTGRQLWVHLRRTDVVGQAISHYRARQTGLWRADAEGGRTFGERDVHDADLSELRDLVARARDRDERWTPIFRRYGIEPMAVTYEELAESLNPTLRRIVAPIDGVDAHEIEAPLRRQADAASEMLRQRLLARYPELADASGR